MYDYAVIMPVYNEVETIDAVIAAIRDHYHGELIIIDDGSTDGTKETVAAHDDVLPVFHEENLGYGRSLLDGLVFASFAGLQYVVTMDCDGQHEPKHIPEFLDAVIGGAADIVSGSRYLPDSGATGEAPASRREINEKVTAEINAVTGWGLTDAFCGFKAYRMQALLGMTLNEPGYAMPLELWAKAWKAGLSVVEMPVERIYIDGDRSFGADLDDPEKRLEYYLRVWREALEEQPA